MSSDDARVRQVMRRSYELDHKHYAIGIEIQPYKLVGVVITSEGTVAARSRTGLSDMEPEAVVQGVVELARGLVDNGLGGSVPRSRVCLGVQVGGPVDTDTGLVRHLVNGPDDHGKEKPPPYEWVEFPLGPTLSSATGWDTVVENDAHAFAAYEQKFGVGRRTGTFAAVLVRDGVGAGVVVRRERLRMPMEFGHLRVWPQGRTCDCGMRGCIESQVGTRALTGAIREATGRELDGLEAAIGLADGNGPHALAALAAFRKAGVSIARGLAHLLTLFGPSHLVLYAAHGLLVSSPEHRAANAFLSAVRTYRAHAFRECRGCRLVTRPLAADRGAHGAALIALQDCFGVRLQSH